MWSRSLGAVGSCGAVGGGNSGDNAMRSTDRMPGSCAWDDVEGLLAGGAGAVEDGNIDCDCKVLGGCGVRVCSGTSE